MLELLEYKFLEVEFVWKKFCFKLDFVVAAYTKVF